MKKPNQVCLHARERESAILMHETLRVHPSEHRLSLPERKNEIKLKSKNKYKRGKNKDKEERKKLSNTAIRFNTPHGT